MEYNFTRNKYTQDWGSEKVATDENYNNRFHLKQLENGSTVIMDVTVIICKPI